MSSVLSRDGTLGEDLRGGIGIGGKPFHLVREVRQSLARGRGIERAVACGDREQGRADLEQVEDIVLREGRHARAEARDLLDVAELGQGDQGFAHRRAAHGVLLREGELLQPLTGREAAGHDVLENPLGQELGERFDGFAEGIGA